MKDPQLAKLKEQIRYLELKQRDKLGAALYRLKKQTERLQKHPSNKNATVGKSLIVRVKNDIDPYAHLTALVKDGKEIRHLRKHPSNQKGT